MCGEKRYYTEHVSTSGSEGRPLTLTDPDVGEKGGVNSGFCLSLSTVSTPLGCVEYRNFTSVQCIT